MLCWCTSRRHSRAKPILSTTILLPLNLELQCLQTKLSLINFRNLDCCTVMLESKLESDAVSSKSSSDSTSVKGELRRTRYGDGVIQPKLLSTSRRADADFIFVTIRNNLAKTVDPRKEMYSFRRHTVLARWLQKVPHPGSRSNFLGPNAV
jgi:hypothetical protein